MKDRASVVFVGGPELPAVGGDDGPANRKSQAHAMQFGREERFKDIFQIFSGNSRALIDNGYLGAIIAG